MGSNGRNGRKGQGGAQRREGVPRRRARARSRSAAAQRRATRKGGFKRWGARKFNLRLVSVRGMGSNGSEGLRAPTRPAQMGDASQRHVQNGACGQRSTWPEADPDPLSVTLDVSHRQLQSQDSPRLVGCRHNAPLPTSHPPLPVPLSLAASPLRAPARSRSVYFGISTDSDRS